MSTFPYSHLIDYYDKLTNPLGSVDLSRTELVWSGSTTTLYLPYEDNPSGHYLINGIDVYLRQGQTCYAGAYAGGGWNYANIYFIQASPYNGTHFQIQLRLVGHYTGTRYVAISSAYKVG